MVPSSQSDWITALLPAFASETLGLAANEETDLKADDDVTRWQMLSHEVTTFTVNRLLSL